MCHRSFRLFNTSQFLEPDKVRSPVLLDLQKLVQLLLSLDVFTLDFDSSVLRHLLIFLSLLFFSRQFASFVSFILLHLFSQFCYSYEVLQPLITVWIPQQLREGLPPCSVLPLKQEIISIVPEIRFTLTAANLRLNVFQLFKTACGSLNRDCGVFYPYFTIHSWRRHHSVFVLLFVSLKRQILLGFFFICVYKESAFFFLDFSRRPWEWRALLRSLLFEVVKAFLEYLEFFKQSFLFDHAF